MLGVFSKAKDLPDRIQGAAIFAYIVGKYSSPMDPMGKENVEQSLDRLQAMAEDHKKSEPPMGRC